MRLQTSKSSPFRRINPATYRYSGPTCGNAVTALQVREVLVYLNRLHQVHQSANQGVIDASICSVAIGSIDT
jgi:hypothetical protein